MTNFWNRSEERSRDIGEERRNRNTDEERKDQEYRRKGIQVRRGSSRDQTGKEGAQIQLRRARSSGTVEGAWSRDIDEK